MPYIRRTLGFIAAFAAFAIVARAGIVTEGTASYTGDGLTVSLEWKAGDGYKILDETPDYTDVTWIQVPKGTPIELKASWGELPAGGIFEKATLTLSRREGDETIDATSGNSISTNFTVGVAPGTENTSPGGMTLAVVWQKLVQAATQDTPAVYQRVTTQVGRGIMRPMRTVEAKMPGDADDKAVLYNDFEFFLTPYNTPYVDELTGEKDAFNVRYGIHVSCPSPDGPNASTARAGVLARVVYLSSHYKSPWGTTDANGGTTVTLGSAGIDLPAHGTYYAPALYVSAAPLTADGSAACPAYKGRTLTLPALKDFIGTLKLKVTDMDDNPLRATVNVWGGQYLLSNVSATGTADSAGNASIRLLPWKASTGTSDQDIHLPPYVNISSDITNIVDGAQMNLVDGRPAFLSPHFWLHDDAYTFKDKGAASKKARIQYLDKDDNVVAEFGVHPELKRDSSISNGRDRHFYEITPTRDLKLYKARVVYDDPDGGPDPIVASGTAEFRAQARWERAMSGAEMQFRICAVGPWAGQTNDFFTRMSPQLRLLQTAMADEVMPIRITFSNGPAFTPQTAFYQRDIWALQELVKELDQAQRGSPFNRIVGIVPPNYLDTEVGGKVAGLMFDAYPGAFLIDPSKIGAHGSMHEFLHTLGLPDLYEGDYYGTGKIIPPPSSNGYKPVSYKVVANIPKTYPNFQAILYDHARTAWAQDGEFGTLLRFACRQITTSPAPQAAGIRDGATLQAATGTISISGAFKTDKATFWTADLNPVFADTGTAQNPYAGKTYGDYYVRVVGASNNTLAAVYITGGNKYNATRVLNENGSASKFHGVGIDKNLRAAFSATLPIDANNVSRIELGPSNEWGQFAAIWNTITVSANAPAISSFSPAAPSTLSGAFTLSWKATDADPADAAKLLNHRVLVSDGGVTWSLVSSAAQYDWGTQKYSCTLNAADFPQGSKYAFKILCSDGLRTSRLVTPATYTISGFNPNPVASLGVAAWDGKRPDTGPLALAVPIGNTGNGMLTVIPDAASLPSWLTPTLRETRIAPRSTGLLALTGDLPTSGVYQKTIGLKTNDPAHPTLSLPIKIVQGPTTTAPSVHRIEVGLFGSEQRPFQPGEIVNVTAWEYASRGGLNAFMTIERVSPGCAIVVDRAPMEAGAWPGQYQATWEIPSDIADGQYAVEITLADPKGGAGDSDGLAPGQDASFLIRRFNSSPVFTLPSASETSMTVTVDQECVLSYNVSDPDGDALDLAVNGFPFPYYWDRAGKKIRWYPSASGVGYQLVLSARDAHGAIATRTWKFAIKDSTATIPANRAVPSNLPGYSTLVSGQIYYITVAATGQKGCRVDYRLAGSSTWTQGSILPYKDLEVSPGHHYIYAEWDWSKLGLQSNKRYELRFVNIDAGNKADSSPITRLVFTSAVAGTITQVKAPAKVVAGQPFTIQVTARNDSTQAWNSGSGIKAAPNGTDPFYSGRPLTLSGWQQVTQGATIAWGIDVAAPSAAGAYTTRWSLLDAQGAALGSAAEAAVTVVADPGVTLAEMRAYLLNTWTPGSSWLGKADLNKDGKVNVADLVAINNLLK